MARKKTETSDTPPAQPAEVSDASIEQRLRIHRASLEKQFGKGTVQSLDDTLSIAPTRFPYQIPTGSLSLDIALGSMFRRPDGSWQHGLPPGRIVEIFGPNSSGKSTLCDCIVANAQHLGKRAAVNDMEHSRDPAWMKTPGVRLDRLEFTQPSSGDQCAEIMEAQIKSQLFDIVVIDSIAALIPQSELDGDMGHATMGSHARLMSQICRKINPLLAVKGANTTLIFTNQMRFKVGVMYGNPETTPGGEAMKFYASVRLDVRQGDKIKEGDQIIGHRVKVNVIKNKIGSPFQKAEFPLMYGKGVDFHGELFELAAGRGILEVKGAWFGYKAQSLGQGREATVQTMRERPAIAYALYNDLLSQINAERGWTPEGQPIPGFKRGNDTPVAGAFSPLPNTAAGPAESPVAA